VFQHYSVGLVVFGKQDCEASGVFA